MSDAVRIKVEPRDAQKNKGTGTRVARRLRKGGRIPAVIYGHKQAVVPVTLSHDDAVRMVKAPGHLAELDLGGSTETVLIRDVQWNHLGKEVLHLDFARVSAEEIIETDVSLEARGQAAGQAAGGIVEQVVHSLRIKCPAGAIPDAIRVDISELQLDQAIHVSDLKLPPDVTIVDADPELLLIHVVSRAAEPEPTEGAGEGPAEPQVIKPERKEKEKEG